jgi:hypothetical protein
VIQQKNLERGLNNMITTIVEIVIALLVLGLIIWFVQVVGSIVLGIVGLAIYYFRKKIHVKTRY